MKAFLITYDGLWLTGKAIVIAKTKKTALKLLEADPQSLELTDVEVKEVFELDKPQVLYNDNGDY
jgi:hypothetical protein